VHYVKGDCGVEAGRTSRGVRGKNLGGDLMSFRWSECPLYSFFTFHPFSKSNRRRKKIMAENNNSVRGNVGFLGLGSMGIGMAKNLREKLPRESTLVICDVNQARIDEFLGKFASEKSVLDSIKVVKTPREVIDLAVS
jgi:hypothetical protein